MLALVAAALLDTVLPVVAAAPQAVEEGQPPAVAAQQHSQQQSLDLIRFPQLPMMGLPQPQMGLPQPQMVFPQQQQQLGFQPQIGFQQPQMGLQLGQPPTGLSFAQQPQQPWGAWPGVWNPMALPPKPVKEVPLPRMLMPGLGISDMPTFDAYLGLPAQSEADDDDATSSYNATEVQGSREAEIRRLEAQIKLSFHKEASGIRIEPTPET